MPERSGFFDSTAEDVRLYPARDFADYFAQILTSGVFNGGQYLNPTASGTDTTISISPGYAWIKGYVYSIYTTPLSLQLQPASNLPRVDRIVLRLDTSLTERSIRAVILQGTPASSPVPPAIVRSGDIYDLSLAQVRVNANTTIITQSNITDERLNTSLCGLVNSLVKVDTTSFQQEFDAFMDNLANSGFATVETVNDKVLTGGYGQSTNSGNAYSVTITPAPQALVAGLRVMVKINASSTGAATLNVNGLGPKSILKPNGNSLGANALRANSVYTFVYSGSAFILQGEGGEYGTAEAGDVRSTKTIGTDSGIVTGTLITRNTEPTVITPSGAEQTLNPGVYDYPITVLAGIEYASGNATSSTTTTTAISGSQVNYYYITVTGLGFRPNRIILRFNYGGSNNSGMTIYNFATRNGAPTSAGTNFNFALVNSETLILNDNGYLRVHEFTVTLPTNGFAVSNNSFRLPILMPSLLVSWEALKI